MRILSLDLGTNTGWAVGQDGVLTDCGTWTLATAKEIKVAGLTRMNRRLDPRIPALWNKLVTAHAEEANFDWVVFEDVQFGSTTLATQLWSSFRATVWLFAAIHRVQIECLPTGKLKLFGAGHGGATKEMMMPALARKYPENFTLASDGRLHYIGTSNFLDDNAADAVHLLHWAQKTLKNI